MLSWFIELTSPSSTHGRTAARYFDASSANHEAEQNRIMERHEVC